METQHADGLLLLLRIGHLLSQKATKATVPPCNSHAPRREASVGSNQVRWVAYYPRLPSLRPGRVSALGCLPLAARSCGLRCCSPRKCVGLPTCHTCFKLRASMGNAQPFRCWLACLEIEKSKRREKRRSSITQQLK